MLEGPDTAIREAILMPVGNFIRVTIGRARYQKTAPAMCVRGPHPWLMKWINRLIDFMLLHQQTYELTPKNFIMVLLSVVTALLMVALLGALVVVPLAMLLSDSKWSIVGLVILALEGLLFWVWAMFTED